MQKMDISISALINAIDDNDTVALSQLIGAGGDVNGWDEDGQQPLLHLAAYKSNYDAMECLLKHGADVRAKDGSGFTLLMFAFSKELPRLVELALTYGDHVDDAMLDVTWLLLARLDNVPLMQQLHARGATLSATVPDDFLCKLGGQAVHPSHRLDRFSLVMKTDDFDADSLVGYNALMLAIAFECTQLATWLVTLPFDVNHRSANGISVLLDAASNDGYANVVEALIAKGANPNAADDSGWSALQAALRNNATKNAQALLTAGADACYIDDDGYSTLMAAARGGCEALVPALISQGVTVNAEWEGKTALDIALHHLHHAMAAMITAAGGTHGSQPTYENEVSTNTAIPDGYMEDLVAQLKICIPNFDAEALLSMTPPDAFEDEYGNQTTVLYWLYDGLEAQGLMEYQEWKNYWGDLPALAPLKGLELGYDSQPLLDALEKQGRNDDMWDTPPYLELMNHHLTPHGLQFISFAFENLYMFCVHDDDTQVDKLAALLELAGIPVVTHPAMDLPTCLTHLL